MLSENLSKNPFESQKIHFKARKSIWQPEYAFESQNIHFKVRISIWKSEYPFESQNIHLKARISILRISIWRISILRISYWKPEYPFESQKIHFEARKSIWKPENPFQSQKIHFKARKSIWKAKNPFERQPKELEAFHFFLPHGLKLPPPLSQAIFAINSPLWFNFAFLPWNIIVECELNFYTRPDVIFEIQICICEGWNENLRGNRFETKRARVKGFYTGGLPPLKSRFVIPAGLVLAAP